MNIKLLNIKAMSQWVIKVVFKIQNAGTSTLATRQVYF